MLPEINKIKGIHPGAIIKREIKKRGIKNKDLALLVNEHAQTISAIIKEKRSINPKLSIKLGETLGVEPDYFMYLQASYDIKKIQSTITNPKQNQLTIRKILFWDTDFDEIDYVKNKSAVIRRIFERGNAQEINEIISFYGIDSIKSEVDSINNSYLSSFQYNVNKYLKTQ